MEDLNKNQIVLLTLLVSFVTSIATGIMTVSMLQQAPLEVTRNINRIVEKTIEKVTPANILTSVPQKKEITTVIVKEEDSIIDAINQNIKSIVRIREKSPLAEGANFYGIGLVVSKDGLLVAHRKNINIVNIYTVTMSDETEFKLIPMGVDKNTNFILFKANLPEKTVYTFVPATLGNLEPKLGQTLGSIGGEISNTVSVGRAVSLQMKDSGTGTTTTKYLSGINTDISTRDLNVGSPLLNLSGHVVGVMLTPEESRVFIPISMLKKELIILQESLKSQ